MDGCAGLCCPQFLCHVHHHSRGFSQGDWLVSAARGSLLPDVALSRSVSSSAARRGFKSFMLNDAARRGTISLRIVSVYTSVPSPSVPLYHLSVPLYHLSVSLHHLPPLSIYPTVPSATASPCYLLLCTAFHFPRVSFTSVYRLPLPRVSFTSVYCLPLPRVSFTSVYCLPLCLGAITHCMVDAVIAVLYVQ